MSSKPFFKYLKDNTYNALINVIKKNIQVISPKKPPRRVNIEEISSKVLEDILREYLKKSRYSKVTEKDFVEIVNIALSRNRILEKKYIQVKEGIYADLLKELNKFDYNMLKNALISAILKNKGS